MKRFSVLGDSISTLFGYSQPPEAAYYTYDRCRETGVFDMADTWWGQVIAALGGELLVNNSFAGSTVSRLPIHEIPSYGCSDERTAALGKSPDVILVLLGLNDCGNGVKLRPDAGEEQSPAVFSVAYTLMLEKLKRNYPHADIRCLTLPVRHTEDARREERLRRIIGPYCQVIRECAAAQGCRVVELFDAKAYPTRDLVHPTAEGMKIIADAVLGQLAKEEGI